MGVVSVNLKKNWFGPDASLHEVRNNPHEFPAEYAAKPVQAEGESDEAWAKRKERQPYAVLPSSAVVLPSVKTEPLDEGEVVTKPKPVSPGAPKK